MKYPPSLSVIIPTLNEASRLPLLLADLKRWSSNLDVIVVDGGSTDCTASVAQLSGATFLPFPHKNRGAQLKHGASHSKGEWMLFLHADSRLHLNWPVKIEEVIQTPSGSEIAWYFDFKVQRKGAILRLLEVAVAIRSRLFKRPYGDQGLLIKRILYDQFDGYKSLHLMEDIDFVIRISRQNNLKSLGIPLYTDYRRWEKFGVLLQAFRNAQLRHRWMKGERSESLLEEYEK